MSPVPLVPTSMESPNEVYVEPVDVARQNALPKLIHEN